MSFLQIKPRDKYQIVILSVVRGTLEVIPDVHINITDLNRSGWKRYKHFFNNGYGGVTFKCQVIFNKNARSDGVHYLNKPNIMLPVHELVNNWYIDATPLMISTDAMDLVDHDGNANIINDLYVITKISSKKQTSDNYSTWEMEFTSYTPLNLAEYKNDNSAVLQALNKAKEANSKKALDQKLNQCVLATLKFSKKPKNVDCVKIMQQFLKKKNLLINSNPDGWYNDLTRKAVKDYQKKYKLKATGKVDAKTFKHMCKG